MKILFVRHGESTWNAQGRYQGRRDPPLSPRGVAQAQALAAHLQKVKIGAILSSPLQRALGTANVCADAANLSVRVDESLTEICHGEWEGELLADVARRWPDMLAQWRDDPTLVRFPGGETLDEVSQRLSSFVRRASTYEAPLLVVTHDVIVRLAMLSAAGKPLAAFNAVRADNAALSEFALESGRLKAVRLNTVEHLGTMRTSMTAQAL